MGRSHRDTCWSCLPRQRVSPIAQPSATTTETIRELLDGGFGLADVDSTDDHLVLELDDGGRRRRLRLSRDRVQALARAGLLDQLAQSAARLETDARCPVGGVIA